MTLEKHFAKQVEYLLDVNGWVWKHDETSMRPDGRFATAFRGKRGFPDYIAVRGDRIILAELKSETGRLSQGQKDWLEAFRFTNKVEVFVWRPKDFDDIRKVLR